MYDRAGSPANKANTQADSVIKKRFIKTGHTCLGVSDGTGLTLTGADRHDSLLWSRRGSEPAGTVHSWSPYGSGKPAAASLPGFNGERLDPVSGTYHLGKGYRAYNPVLMRFNCPDDLSPFGAGGINPYAYCAGDPVNHIDPSGHLSWQSILGITLGAIGLAAVIFTGGASIIAAGGVMAAVSSASATALTVGSLGVVADVTAIASGAVEGSDPEASSILGWVSLATGLAGAATGIGMGMRSAMGSRIALHSRGPGFSSISGRKTSTISLASGNVKSTQFIKGFSIEPKYRSDGNFSSYALSGYVSDFRGTGEPGLIVHGGRGGELFFYENIKPINPGPAPRFKGVENFVGHLNEKFGIDLLADKGKRLHLVACYGGKKGGAAQELANYLKRPVVAYGGNEPVYVYGLKELLGRPRNMQSSYVYKKPSHSFHRANTRSFSIAEPITFYPPNTIS